MQEWFEYYCTRFPTVELNNTFYRIPTIDALRGWYRRSPAGFVFSVKAPRLITHLKRFNETGPLQRDFYRLLSEGLGDKLGPVLFQLPGTTAYDPAVLDRILRDMEPSFTNVVEFRNATWWRADVYEALAARGVTFCSVSYPNLPDDVIPSDLVYYRFHGVPSLWRSSYSPVFLQRIIDTLSADKGVKKAYLYFNNTASGAAYKNADWIISAGS